MNATQAESIMRHGLALERLFGPTGLGPITLCTRLHHIEMRAHRQAERECSEEGYDTSEAACERREKAILAAVDRILGFRVKGIPVIVNGDPRGYALKIAADWMRAHPEAQGLHQDWGGYGIIAPEFSAS